VARQVVPGVGSGDRKSSVADSQHPWTGSDAVNADRIKQYVQALPKVDRTAYLI